MLPVGNVGSELVETSKKRKTGRVTVTTKSTSKGVKAADEQMAEAAETTLPPIAEKTTKLMKVTESLARRQTKAAMIAAAEWENKKAQDITPLTILEK
jgi:hypothetical protein